MHKFRTAATTTVRIDASVRRVEFDEGFIDLPCRRGGVDYPSQALLELVDGPVQFTVNTVMCKRKTVADTAEKLVEFWKMACVADKDWRRQTSASSLQFWRPCPPWACLLGRGLTVSSRSKETVVVHHASPKIVVYMSRERSVDKRFASCRDSLAQITANAGADGRNSLRRKLSDKGLPAAT